MLKAALEGNTDIVKALVDAGADITIKNKNGKTALDCAKSDEIRKILQNAEQIRADYLKDHPESAKGLKETLQSLEEGQQETGEYSVTDKALDPNIVISVTGKARR